MSAASTGARRVMVVIGTRPEAIKMAPLVHAVRDDPDLSATVVVTGQHREMVDQAMAFFDLQADVDLDGGLARPSLVHTTQVVLERLSAVLADHEPDAVVVQGDTTSAFSAALAAFYACVPVVHLEAGLRTKRLDSPFPEEGNRRLITQLAALHLAPTAGARDHLLAAAVPECDIVVTGNTVVDALYLALARHRRFDEPRLRSLDDHDRPVLLVTAHRRESWGRGLAEVVEAVGQLARTSPDLEIVFPVHRNPVVRDAVVPALRDVRGVTLVDPVGYGDLVRLLQRATLVLTDSGGIQEEAPSVGTPVLVTRDTTERQEGIDAGTARLVGTDRTRIVTEVRRLLENPRAYAAMAGATNPYGDGWAAARSVAAVRGLLGLASRVDALAS